MKQLKFKIPEDNVLRLILAVMLFLCVLYVLLMTIIYKKNIELNERLAYSIAFSDANENQTKK